MLVDRIKYLQNSVYAKCILLPFMYVSLCFQNALNTRKETILIFERLKDEQPDLNKGHVCIPRKSSSVMSFRSIGYSKLLYISNKDWKFNIAVGEYIFWKESYEILIAYMKPKTASSVNMASYSSCQRKEHTFRVR